MADKTESRAKVWWNGVKAEWNKIIWPGRSDLWKQTGTVAVVSVVLSAIIAILDYLIKTGFDWLIKI